MSIQETRLCKRGYIYWNSLLLTDVSPQIIVLLRIEMEHYSKVFLFIRNSIIRNRTEFEPENTKLGTEICHN